MFSLNVSEAESGNYDDPLILGLRSLAPAVPPPPPGDGLGLKANCGIVHSFFWTFLSYTYPDDIWQVKPLSLTRMEKYRELNL